MYPALLGALRHLGRLLEPLVRGLLVRHHHHQGRRERLLGLLHSLCLIPLLKVFIGDVNTAE